MLEELLGDARMVSNNKWGQIQLISNVSENRVTRTSKARLGNAECDQSLRSKIRKSLMMLEEFLGEPRSGSTVLSITRFWLPASL